MIVKVNGQNVTEASHSEVVELIQGRKLNLSKIFYPPFFRTLLFYQRFAPQMALLRFYQDSSLCTFLVQVFTLEHVTTGIVRERAHGRST